MGRPSGPSAMVGMTNGCYKPCAAQWSSFSIGIEAEDYTDFKCDLTGGFFPFGEKQNPTLLHSPLPFTLRLDVIKDLNRKAMMEPIQTPLLSRKERWSATSE